MLQLDVLLEIAEGGPGGHVDGRDDGRVLFGFHGVWFGRGWMPPAAARWCSGRPSGGTLLFAGGVDALFGAANRVVVCFECGGGRPGLGQQIDHVVGGFVLREEPELLDFGKDRPGGPPGGGGRVASVVVGLRGLLLVSGVPAIAGAGGGRVEAIFVGVEQQAGGGGDFLNGRFHGLFFFGGLIGRPSWPPPWPPGGVPGGVGGVLLGAEGEGLAACFDGGRRGRRGGVFCLPQEAGGGRRRRGVGGVPGGVVGPIGGGVRPGGGGGRLFRRGDEIAGGVGVGGEGDQDGRLSELVFCGVGGVGVEAGGGGGVEGGPGGGGRVVHLLFSLFWFSGRRRHGGPN